MCVCVGDSSHPLVPPRACSALILRVQVSADIAALQRVRKVDDMRRAGTESGFGRQVDLNVQSRQIGLCRDTRAVDANAIAALVVE